jgi:prolyl-tRNA synthetase
LPPKLAPYQGVVVPIYKNDSEKSTVMKTVARVTDNLRGAGYRIHVDEREGIKPGFKFNDWELRGVPVRIEIGPRDVEKGTVAFARRDILGKDGKTFRSQDSIIPGFAGLMNDIQVNMLAEATAFRDENLHDVDTYDQFKEVVKDGWALIWHCGRAECEDEIKQETKASSRLFPLDQEKGKAKCVHCGQDATEKAYFARAY